MSQYPIEKTDPKALVVQCSDARFQDAFKRFMIDDLGLPNFYPLAIGGGVHALGAKDTMPDSYTALYGQIKFFIEEVPLKLVVLINHQDCKWYQGHADLSDFDEDTQAMADLKIGKTILSADFPDVEIRTFWAGLDGDSVTFSEVFE